MPLFDYICPKCNNVKEVLLSLNASSYEVEFCDKCGHVMNRKFPLPQPHIMGNALLKKAQNEMGTHDLEPSQLKKTNGPRMWRGPSGGKLKGRVGNVRRK